MAGSVATVRESIRVALLTVQGTTNSRFAPEFFGRDTSQLIHKSFAVGSPSTEPASPERRQSLSDGALVVSMVEVHWAYRLRDDRQSLDYDDACDFEQALVTAACGVASQHVLIHRLERGARVEGFVIGRAAFAVLHRYTLS